jgi:hypothetical protein
MNTNRHGTQTSGYITVQGAVVRMKSDWVWKFEFAGKPLPKPVSPVEIPPAGEFKGW